MKLLHLRNICCVLITYKFAIISAVSEENNYGHQKVKYFADPDYRLHSQYYHYSNTEFDHAVDDSRCRDGLYHEHRPIVKDTPYGNVRGRQINLCDKPGLQLRERPGQPLTHGRKAVVRVFLGIPYAEPPVRRRNAENLQFKVRNDSYVQDIVRW